MNGTPTDLEHNTCIFLDFRNILVLWVSRKTFFSITKQKKISAKGRKGFPYVREGSNFCKSTKRNLHSRKVEFHVQERELWGKQIRDVLVASSLSCRKMRATRAVIDEGSSLQLPGDTAGVGAGGNRVKDLSLPLYSVLHVCLSLAERDVDYSATVGDEIRPQNCIWIVQGNMRWIIPKWPCLVCAMGFKDTGGSQIFWRHHLWAMPSLHRQDHSVRAVWVCLCCLCRFSGASQGVHSPSQSFPNLSFARDIF